MSASPDDNIPPDAATPGAAETRTHIALRDGYRVETAESEGSSRLEVRAPTGRLVLTMRFRPEGPVLEVEGASLSVATHGDLRVSAERLLLTARGDAEIACGGNLTLRSETGDVRIKANDDVRLDGERIALNSPDPPQGPHITSPHTLPRG